MVKRNTTSAQFKIRVAVEGAKGLQSAGGIAAGPNKIHPIQVTAWKRELRGRAAWCVGRKNAKSDANLMVQSPERRLWS